MTSFQGAVDGMLGIGINLLRLLAESLKSWKHWVERMLKLEVMWGMHPGPAIHQLVQNEKLYFCISGL